MSRFTFRSRLIAVAIGLFTCAPGVVVPASAQEGDPELGASTWRTGPCRDCHGWAGDGVAEVPQFEGANLRESQLTPEAMFEVIRCGLPGSAMPTWRNNSWTEIIPCYGMTAPLDSGQPPRGGRTFSDRTISALVAFIFRDFVGKGPVTREYCQETLGADSDRCRGYPTAAEVEARAAREAG